MKHTLLLLTLWVLTSTAVVAQHQIPRSVFGNGATTTSGGSFKIVGTLGQPAIGLMSTNDHTSLAGFWYTTSERATSIEQIEDEGLPRGFRLDQNYPNPFNPMTTLSFAIPQRAHVTLKVFDSLGRAVSTWWIKRWGLERTGWFSTRRTCPAACTSIVLKRRDLCRQRSSSC